MFSWREDQFLLDQPILLSDNCGDSPEQAKRRNVRKEIREGIQSYAGYLCFEDIQIVSYHRNIQRGITET